MIKEQHASKEKKQMKQRESPTGLTDSIFDWDGLLHRLMGDEDLAIEIIDDFLKQMPDKLFAVKKALDNEDLPLVQREAHIIKGASGNVGALTMQEIAEQIEIAGKEKDLVRAGSFVAELDRQLEILKIKLSQPMG